jgi:membrane-bound metal-dependent hydrolase YbcI (DUF457 family)
MIFGHFALASLAKQTVFQRQNSLLLMFAAVMPDLLDKPANLLLGLPGRGIGHSLVMLLILVALTWIVCSRLKLNSDFILPGTVMWLSHLAGDFIAPKVFFWPFLGDLDPPQSFQLWEKIRNFYLAGIAPEQLWLEALCISAALALWFYKSVIPRLGYMSLANQEAERDRRL